MKGRGLSLRKSGTCTVDISCFTTEIHDTRNTPNTIGFKISWFAKPTVTCDEKWPVFLIIFNSYCTKTAAIHELLNKTHNIPIHVPGGMIKLMKDPEKGTEWTQYSFLGPLNRATLYNKTTNIFRYYYQCNYFSHLSNVATISWQIRWPY